MRLVYRLTEADYVHFNEHHIADSPTIKRSERRYRFFPSFIFLAAALLRHANHVEAVLFLLFGIGWLVLAPIRWKRLVHRRLERLLREGDNTTLFGSRSLSITPEGLAEVSETGRSEVMWRGISKVALGKYGVYLYNSGTSAYIVPNSAFDAVNTREHFIGDALRYREQAAGIVEAL